MTPTSSQSVPAITPDSLYMTPGYPVRQQQKTALSRSSSAGIFGTVFLATTVFVLSLMAEIVFQQTVKNQPCETKTKDASFKGCMVRNCSGFGTPTGLIGTSLILTLILSIISTVYGACPCCCFRHIYAKNINFALSVLFLVLLWITFVVLLFFGFADVVALTIRSDDNLCIKVPKGQLLSIAILGALLGFFGSAHIATANASRSTGPSNSDIPIGVPIGIPA